MYEQKKGASRQGSSLELFLLLHDAIVSEGIVV
jgi:hypothetical protein